jgi:hypothetical protein
MPNIPVLPGGVAGVNVPDITQTLFTIPEEITHFFQSLGNAVQAAERVDYAGVAFVVGGVTLMLFGLGGILVEETLQKPGQEFISEGGLEKLIKAVK